jgi:carboxypeptidase family protein
MKVLAGLLSVAIVVCSGIAFAQSQTTAVLSGSVTDPSEAVVPGAKITLASTETGAIREVSSDEHGTYRLLSVTPGTYDIRVEKPGFSAHTQRGIVLTVGETATLNVKLTVGPAGEVIEVTTEGAVVETVRSQQSETIGAGAVNNLPINRRDYLTFALLAPGVNDSKAMADSTSFRVKQTPDSGLSFYGSNGRGNSVTLDGGEINTGGGAVRPNVSQEAVQEFQINRTNYSAEHGGSRGGVINIVTKSGSNVLHGSGFGFFRHQALDAGDPFAIALQGDKLVRVKPDSQRQQFGGALGGRVVRDRTFFFVGYEQLRRRESAAVPVLTSFSIFQPTPAQEAILAGLPAEAAKPLRAALTSPPSTVQMFERNSGIFPFRTDSYAGLWRLDHRFNDANQFNFRYNVTGLYDTNPNLGGLVGNSRGFNQETFDSTALATWTHLFSPRVINEARAQFAWWDMVTASTEPFGPSLEIPGYGFFNRDRFLPSDSTIRREELVNNLSIARGNHSVKLGAYTLIRQLTSDSKIFMAGRFTFGTLPGSFVSPALAATTINALQAFNLGLAQSYQQGFGEPVVRGINPLYAGFAQDSWKVRENLTVNYGLRYEVDTRWRPLPTNKKNFAPRIGFAWDPANDHKTVVRGGYGLFYSPIDIQIEATLVPLGEMDGYRPIAQVLSVLSAANPLAVNGPVNIFKTLRDQGAIGVPTPQRPILESDLKQFGITLTHTGPRPPLTVLFAASPDYPNPVAQQASFEIQRELSRGLTASIGYVFVRGAHLTSSYDANLLTPPINPAKGIRDWGATADNPSGAKYFKDPLLYQYNVYDATANSFYHGMVIEASKRFSPRVSLNFNYTFSKAIDETTDYNSDFQPTDQTCRRCERALSSFDQRHKVTAYAMLQGTQARSGIGKLLSDFTFTPIFRYNSSRPFNLLAGSELNNDRHNTTDRPYFAGRNTGIGPSFWTFDEGNQQPGSDGGGLQSVQQTELCGREQYGGRHIRAIQPDRPQRSFAQ